MLSLQIKFGFIVEIVMASLLMLALPCSIIAATRAATTVASNASHTPYQYWRSGNPADTQTTTQGGIAMIGGGKDLDDAFSWLCARSDGGNFLVLRASGTDAYNPYIQGLCHENSVATLLVPSRKAAFDPAARKRIASAQAIFISGGDQAKYVNFWQNTPVQRAIDNAIRRGVPVGGTSAGLAVQGEFMYSAQQDPADGPDLSSAMALKNPYLARVTIVRNFLSIPAHHDTITDTHFSRRDRMGRLLVFMARILQSGDVRSIHAIAIDEHTAALLEPDGRGRVAGTGAVYFLKASSKAQVCRPGVPLTFEDVSVVKLRAGAMFDTTGWNGAGIHYQLSVRDGIADPQQLTIGGYSYGGYMTNWLITQTTRFRAAVTGAGAVEHAVNWGNDDLTFDDAWYLGGAPWEAENNYNAEAAMWQMNKVHTPTHLVVGANDIRVAAAESYLMERELHTLGVPAALLVFPGEGHLLGNNPWHGKIKVREELKWLDTYSSEKAP